MDGEQIVSVSTPYLAGSTVPGSDAWAAEAAVSGGRGTQRITFAGLVEAPPGVAGALRLVTPAQVVVRRRLVSLNDVPVELAESYYPAAVAAGTPLASPSKIKGGAAALLGGLGLHAARVREEILARQPTTNERATLDMSASGPVLVLSRLSMDASDAPNEYAVMTMRAEGRVLRYEFGSRP